MLMGGLLMAKFGWRPFFLVLGLTSLLWLLPWINWLSDHVDTGRDLLWCRFLQHMGHHADARRTARSGAVDRFSEFCRQPSGHCWPGSHRTGLGADWAPLLGVCSDDRRGPDRYGSVGFRCRTSRAGGVAQEG